MKKGVFFTICIILILSAMFGCSSAAKSDLPAADPAEKASSASAGYGRIESGSDWAAPTPDPAAADMAAQFFDDSLTGALVPDPSRKLIWYGDIQLETTDFDRSVKALYSLIEECGGFIQSSAVTGEGRGASGEAKLRNGRYTVRIPSENFNLFMMSSGNVATVLSSGTRSEDVTSQYFDTEARLKVLRIKEERLIEMLEQTEKVEYKDELQYILQLENELSNVRYEIESLTGTLRRYDDMITYSTVTVYLMEVREYTATPPEPEGIGERIARKFSASLQAVAETSGDIIVWIAGNSPILVILAVIAAAVYLVARNSVKRRKNRSRPPVPPQEKE
jgi:hypothetical protein